MAKETKAQRLGREEAERAALLEEMKTSYMSRAMTLFERADNVNFEMKVRSGVFVLWDSDKRHAETFNVLPEWTEDAEDKLYDLDFAVSMKEEQQAEARRLVEVRCNALNKLTEEEREVLGL